MQIVCKLESQFANAFFEVGFMSKNKSPAFQFYPGDYLFDANTVVFTAEQDGHYLRLLCFCGIEGSIPSGPDQIQNLLKGSSRVDEVT